DTPEDHVCVANKTFAAVSLLQELCVVLRQPKIGFTLELLNRGCVRRWVAVELRKQPDLVRWSHGLPSRARSAPPTNSLSARLRQGEDHHRIGPRALQTPDASRFLEPVVGIVTVSIKIELAVLSVPLRLN